MLDVIGYNISIYEPFVYILEKKQKIHSSKSYSEYNIKLGSNQYLNIAKELCVYDGYS